MTKLKNGFQTGRNSKGTKFVTKTGNCRWSVIVLLLHPTLDSAITRIQSAEIGESALTDWLPHLGGNAMTP
ncbi:MAG TPA: hypothetical protein VJ280_05620 [Dehalococcoidales bacterium]|nr:hypothetical protein [Dehalococcoidales bacterium]